MIITYSKPTIISNIISLTNKRIDTLVINSKLDASAYYLDEVNILWIEKTLIIADYHVRKTLLHLLTKEITNDDRLTLIYNISISHPLQQTIIPQLIEEVLTDYVCEIWLIEKSIIASPNTSKILSELKSVSLINEKRTARVYHIF